MPEMFHAGGFFVLGEGDTLDEVQGTDEWLATAEPVEVRR
jgi:hypothetical protein